MTAPLDEKGLLPCPFCGGPARTFQYNGTAQASCAALHTECAGTDVIAPVAMWNRRALSAAALPDELEVVAWECTDLIMGGEPGVITDVDHAAMRKLQPNAWSVEELVRRSQAHSTNAALRAEVGELKDELEDARAGACITGIGRFAVSRKIEAVTVWDRENDTYERYIPEARAEAEVKRLTEALNEIRELNMSAKDENGHRWANSDLIEQTIVFAMAGARKAMEGGE